MLWFDRKFWGKRPPRSISMMLGTWPQCHQQWMTWQWLGKNTQNKQKPKEFQEFEQKCKTPGIWTNFKFEQTRQDCGMTGMTEDITMYLFISIGNQSIRSSGYLDFNKSAIWQSLHLHKKTCSRDVNLASAVFEKEPDPKHKSNMFYWTERPTTFWSFKIKSAPYLQCSGIQCSNFTWNGTGAQWNT